MKKIKMDSIWVLKTVAPNSFSMFIVGHFGNTIILFVCPPRFCMSIVFVFSWDHCKSQEKLKTMLMQNLGGQTKSIMVFSEVAY